MRDSSSAYLFVSDVVSQLCAQQLHDCPEAFTVFVAEFGKDLVRSQQTIYTWCRQARIDAGLKGGVTTSELAELAAAKRRIRELETELAIHRRATELLKEKTGPKGRTRRSPTKVSRTVN
jgi:transposase